MDRVSHRLRLREFGVKIIVFCNRHGKGERLFRFAILVEPSNENIAWLTWGRRRSRQGIFLDLLLHPGIALIRVRRLHRLIRIGPDGVQPVDPLGVEGNVMRWHYMHRNIIRFTRTLRVLVPAGEKRIRLKRIRLLGRHIIILSKRGLVFYAFFLICNVFGG